MSHAAPRHTRRQVAIALLGAVVVGALATATTPALAGSTRAVTSGWWWAAQTSAAAPVPVAYGTDPGDLLVSRRAGAQEKAAAVWIDLSDLDAPPASFVVDLPERSTDVPVPASGDLLACAVFTEMWQPVQGGQWNARPRSGCTSSDVAFGTRSAAGVWSFDLTAMAASWVSGELDNHGFEIVPSQSLKYPSFEIALRAPSQSGIHGVPTSGDTTTTTAPTTTTTAPAPTTTLPGLPSVPTAPGTPGTPGTPGAPGAPSLPNLQAPGVGLPGTPDLSPPEGPDTPDTPDLTAGDDRDREDARRRAGERAFDHSDPRLSGGSSDTSPLPRRAGTTTPTERAITLTAATGADQSDDAGFGSAILDALVPDLSDPADIAAWLVVVATLSLLAVCSGVWWVRRRSSMGA